MTTSQTFTPVQQCRARKLLKSGLPACAVARTFGISDQLLYYYRKKWASSDRILTEKRITREESKKE